MVSVVPLAERKTFVALSTNPIVLPIINFAKPVFGADISRANTKMTSSKSTILTSPHLDALLPHSHRVRWRNLSTASKEGLAEGLEVRKGPRRFLNIRIILTSLWIFLTWYVFNLVQIYEKSHWFKEKDLIHLWRKNDFSWTLKCCCKAASLVAFTLIS